MASGIVFHNYTTSTGVTFSVGCWVPDTSSPNSGALPIQVLTRSDGTLVAIDNAGNLKINVAAGVNTNGVTQSSGSAPVTQSGWRLKAVPASSAGTVMTGAGSGAVGDRLYSVIIQPQSVNPGTVSVKDGSGAAVQIFVGGTASVGSLIPFPVVLNALSFIGAWSVITGANVTAIGVGDFT